MGRKKLTEEEKREKQREKNRKWREEHPDYRKKYYQEHKEESKEYSKQWCLEHKEERAEQNRRWHLENKERRNEEARQLYKEKKKEYNERTQQYRLTPMGRAVGLVTDYKLADKEHSRGECTLTAKWIVDNIFNQPCHYCGETDWHLLGCDRIDNDLPHTPDNVVPCCMNCNRKRGTKKYEEFMAKRLQMEF